MATNVVVTLPKITVVAETTFTLARLREFPGIPDLPDSVLGPLLEDAMEAIDDVLGPVTVHDRSNGSGELLMLTREVDEIVSVVEDARWTALTLAANDYELSDTGRGLYRLRTGTNPRWHWHGLVKVTYRREDDYATRVRVAVELVRLFLAFNPGLVSQTIGTWSEAYRTDLPYEDQRAAILASLISDPVGLY